MSSFAERVKRYHDAGIWNDEMVRNAHVKGRITDDEMREILGEETEQEESARFAATSAF